jgi:hypothetical protein
MHDAGLARLSQLEAKNLTNGWFSVGWCRKVGTTAGVVIAAPEYRPLQSAAGVGLAS